MTSRMTKEKQINRSEIAQSRYANRKTGISILADVRERVAKF